MNTNMQSFIEDIREFSTIKQIFEENSEMVKYGGKRVKAIDCKVMCILIGEVVNNADISEVQDDNYVFIRRAVDVQERDRLRKKAEQK